MNVENGEVLSLVSLPNFDINLREDVKDKKYMNKITKEFMSLDQFLNLYNCPSFRKWYCYSKYNN